MAYVQPNSSPSSQPMYYSPSSTHHYYSPKHSPPTQQTHTRSPPTSTRATPRERPRSTSAVPPTYGYGSPKPPQEQPSPFAEMGIDPVRMYLQRFHLPDTPENRRDAWELVGRVAQRILDKEEEEARAQQSDDEDEDSDYAEYLAFKEYRRQKNLRRSPKDTGYRPARSSMEGGAPRPPTSQPPQTGYIPSPSALEPMLF
ncbi:hypothetical protein FRC01_009870, partial [Tulasnella sp. 417]